MNAIAGVLGKRETLANHLMKLKIDSGRYIYTPQGITVHLIDARGQEHRSRTVK
jgi:hypothetical protein